MRCFIPPFVLDQLGRSAQLERDAQLRARRASTPVKSTEQATAGLQRTIRDAQHGEDGPVVRTEGQPATGDAATDEAYDGLGATYTFWKDVFNRDSIDGKGLPLIAIVHYETNYDNAFWDGEKMVFGDGDGQQFTRFTIDLDVIGHELGHGVTQTLNNLAYHDEPGALNESYSDVYGSMVQQYHDQQPAAEANWLIGDKLVLPGFPGKALRSMKAPGTAYDGDPQPDNYANFVHTTDDSGGVHINSGIPNKAFYEVANALGGNSWDRAGVIWYDTAQVIASDTSFQQFATSTHQAASKRYGDTSEEAQAVANGWEAVGLSV